MRAICKIDYGQFEFNRIYDYSYYYDNNMKKYHVKGEYGNTEFTKRQFEMMFTTETLNKSKNNSYNF